MLVGEDERDPTRVSNDCSVVALPVQTVIRVCDDVSFMISLNLSVVIRSLKRNGDGVLLLDPLLRCDSLNFLVASSGVKSGMAHIQRRSCFEPSNKIIFPLM